MGDHLIIETLLKYARQENLDEKERALMEKWQARWGEGRPLHDLIHDQEWLWACLYRQHGLPGRNDWRQQQRLIAATGDPLPASRIDIRGVTGVAAATALILVAGIAWFARSSRTATSTSIAIASVTGADHAAASTGQAELFCENGRPILVDSVATNGIIAEEGNMIVRRLNRHTLRYELQADKPAMPMNNFFYAGTKGSYKLLFPDGSWIQLGKGASLRYSPALRGTGEPVVLSGGEAWFSIAKSSAAPLSVTVNGTTVVVLGTEFHVSSAAGDWETKVCVYRGAVRVQQGAMSVTLRDSDEVAVKKNMLLLKKKISDFDALLARTDIDQRFHFTNCSLTEALQQIADHYQIEVSNPTHIRGLPISGDPAQDLPLKALLEEIELIENGNARLNLNSKAILINPVGQP